MGKWNIIHKVRYPPFDHHRWKPVSVPIVEERLHIDLAEEQVHSKFPEFVIQSEEGWLLERSIVSNDNEQWNEEPKVLVDDSAFVNLVDQQRRGWYIIPNNLHSVARRLINFAVILLLVTLTYLFIEPILSAFGIPSLGTKSIRLGLLDYPILTVVVVPFLLMPLLLRIIANFIDLRKQQDYFKNPAQSPNIVLESQVQSGKSIRGKCTIPERRDDWKSISIHWHVGTLPPSRTALVELSGRKLDEQPPVGLSTPLPHHWEEGLDDGTAGGEDAPMERQDIPGGVFLRPMRFSEEGGGQILDDDGKFELTPPPTMWPGTVNSELLRIHWELIIKIKRKKNMPLLWVMPVRVQFPSTKVSLNSLVVNDSRTEHFFIGKR
ncbi:MAG: hypothetical protein DWC00_07895 [Candidatus Poseidoniales archaeon]|nr:MAG: hypothetical protein DWC00_07895 [Candidatus Poseidoniales archaeon]